MTETNTETKPDADVPSINADDVAGILQRRAHQLIRALDNPGPDIERLPLHVAQMYEVAVILVSMLKPALKEEARAN